MKKTLILLSVLFTFLFSACNSENDFVDTPLPTEEPTATLTSTPSPVPTDTPVPTFTPSPSPTDTPTPTSTPTLSPSPTDTPTPTFTPTPSPSPTDTPTPTFTPTPSPSPTNTPTPTFTPTPSPSPTNTPTPTSTPTPTPFVYTITDWNKTLYTTDDVNVRDIPSVNGKKLGTLAKGTLVTITGQCNETSWYRINYNGNVGFISNKYCSTSNPIATPTPQPTTRPCDEVNTSDMTNEEVIENKLPISYDEFLERA